MIAKRPREVRDTQDIQGNDAIRKDECETRRHSRSRYHKGRGWEGMSVRHADTEGHDATYTALRMHSSTNAT